MSHLSYRLTRRYDTAGHWMESHFGKRGNSKAEKRTRQLIRLILAFRRLKSNNFRLPYKTAIPSFLYALSSRSVIVIWSMKNGVRFVSRDIGRYRSTRECKTGSGCSKNVHFSTFLTNLLCRSLLALQFTTKERDQATIVWSLFPSTN